MLFRSPQGKWDRNKPFALSITYNWPLEGKSIADRSVQEMRKLAKDLGVQELSMGMSGDWPEAARAGSTWVRIGSALFGSRT